MIYTVVMVMYMYELCLNHLIGIALLPGARHILNDKDLQYEMLYTLYVCLHLSSSVLLMDMYMYDLFY